MRILRLHNLLLGLALTAFYVLAGVIANGQEAAPKTAAAGGETAEPDHTVVLTNIEFRPNRLQIVAGQTVRFINRDKFKHDVYLVRTANRNQVVISTTNIEPGKSMTVKINDEGLFTLYCTIHGGMSGKITTTGSFELTEEEKRKAAAVKVVPPIVKTGEKLFWGDAQCHRCHRMGERGDGLRGPNLKDIGFRAGFRAKELGLNSATAYIVQSLMVPSAYIVEGYSDDMAKVYQPPIDLGEDQIKTIVTYLQSQGGEVDTWAIDIDKRKLATEPTLNPFRHGDADRGRAVFTAKGCNSCHTVGDQKAISVAPELTAIGAYRNWTWFAQSMLDPNAEIGANWRKATVYLKPAEDEWAGEEVTGMLRKNTDEEVILLVASDRTRTFARDRVERVEIAERSPMPENFGELVTFQEMADLVRYLESLKGPPPANAQSK